MDQNLILEIQKYLKFRELREIDYIQEVWAGHGTIFRFKGDSLRHSYIAKVINVSAKNQHKYNFNSDFALKRKISSYKNEINWYRGENQKNLEDQNSLTPKYITNFTLHNKQILILQDLSESNFLPIKKINKLENERIIKWLANFHAKFFNFKNSGLWEKGNYWHLKTRPDEFKKLNSYDQEMAKKIDNKLQSAKYKTIIHGDAKLANFLSNQQDVAAVDFQYPGGGIGTSDLMYFISSIQTEDIESESQMYLNSYFSYLESAFKVYQPDFKDFLVLKEEWSRLYNYCWVDFYRFLLGWNPNHPKANSFMLEKQKYVYSELSND